MVKRRLEKLTKRIMSFYKVKEVISTNAIMLELHPTIKIHLVINVNRV